MNHPRGGAGALASLPEFLTRADLESLGFGRRAVDAICRETAEVAIPGVRRVYRRRDEVIAYLDAHTYRPDQVRPR
jgi:hypothetical protein